MAADRPHRPPATHARRPRRTQPELGPAEGRPGPALRSHRQLSQMARGQHRPPADRSRCRRCGCCLPRSTPAEDPAAQLPLPHRRARHRRRSSRWRDRDCRGAVARQHGLWRRRSQRRLAQAATHPARRRVTCWCGIPPSPVARCALTYWISRRMPPPAIASTGYGTPSKPRRAEARRYLTSLRLGRCRGGAGLLGGGGSGCCSSLPESSPSGWRWLLAGLRGFLLGGERHALAVLARHDGEHMRQRHVHIVADAAEARAEFHRCLDRSGRTWWRMPRY